MTLYIKQHENVLKINYTIPMDDFSLNFKGFIPITTCLVICLKDKTFIVTVQKVCPKGSYWIKPCEILSFLVYFIPFV